MIVDTSVIVDAVTDAGERGAAARRELSEPGVSWRAPGLLAVEVLSALRRLALDDSVDFAADDIARALDEAEGYGIHIDPIPWYDVRRAWDLSLGSVRYADGVFVAAAERQGMTLITADGRLARSGALVRCPIVCLDSA